MSDFTRALPFELVLEVVSHLDTASIVPFLDAFPWMKQHAYLVFFHRDVPMFFDVAGVERLHSLIKLRNSDLRKQWVHRPIRLVECEWSSASYSGLHGKTTFVFQASATGDTHTRLQRCGKRLEMYGSKWRIGLRTHFSLHGNYCNLPQYTGVVIRSRDLSDTKRYESLITLRLEDVAVFEGTRLPQMRELSLIYGKSTVCRPRIMNIDGPKVTRLLIHFHGCLPQILGLTVGYKRDKPSRRLGKKYPIKELLTFELADTRFIDCGLESTLGQASLPVLDPSQTTECNLQFMETFAALNLIGVPLSLLENVCLDAVTRLYLRLTCPEYCQTLACPLLPNLDTVDIHATKTGCTVPHLEAPNLETLNLFVYAPGVEFSSIWQFSTRLEDLSLYFHPLVMRNLKSANAYSIDHDMWNNLGHQALQNVSNLSIVGSELPFLANRKEQGLVSKVIASSSLQLLLKPFLTPSQLQEESVRIDAISLTDVSPSCSIGRCPITIAPILRPGEHLPPGGALLDFPGVTTCSDDSTRLPWESSTDYESRKRLPVAPIITGSYFSRCLLGDLILTNPRYKAMRKEGLVHWARSEKEEYGETVIHWVPDEWIPC